MCVLDIRSACVYCVHECVAYAYQIYAGLARIESTPFTTVYLVIPCHTCRTYVFRIFGSGQP